MHASKQMVGILDAIPKDSIANKKYDIYIYDLIFDVINDMKYNMMRTNDKWAFNHRMWFYY